MWISDRIGLAFIPGCIMSFRGWEMTFFNRKRLSVEAFKTSPPGFIQHLQQHFGIGVCCIFC